MRSSSTPLSQPFQARMKKPLEKGSDRPQGKVSTSDHEADLDEALAFGVSRGASPSLSSSASSSSRTSPMAMPCPSHCRHPGALNTQRQGTINAEGQIIDKDRLTHDQSYK